MMSRKADKTIRWIHFMCRLGRTPRTKNKGRSIVFLLLLFCFAHHPTSDAVEVLEGASNTEGKCPAGFQSDSEGRCHFKSGDDEEVNLDPYALEEYVLKHEVVMVSFCTESDGKCRLLAPELFKAAAEGAAVGVRFVMVDVAKHVAARAIYGISSVPTLRYFIKGRMEEEDYSGRRLASDMLEATLAKAASRNISSSSSAKHHAAALKTVELSAKTLHDLTHHSPDLNLFVLFYSIPCRQLFLELEAVAHTFAAHANIKVGKVDVVLYPPAFDRFSPHQTPLLAFYGASDPYFGFKPKEVVYADLRLASNMVRFLNRKCGLKEEVIQLQGLQQLGDQADASSIPKENDRDAPAWIFTPAGHE